MRYYVICYEANQLRIEVQKHFQLIVASRSAAGALWDASRTLRDVLRALWGAFGALQGASGALWGAPEGP